jgi:hypothetical protein
MLFKVLPAAIVAAVVSSFSAQAQTLAQIGGPAELPPASYKGAQFIDSRGCVFMNASFSGGAQWVPRVNRNHKVMCGLQPTFGPKAAIASIDVAPDNQVAAPVAVATAEPAPMSAPAAAPMRTVASAMMPAALAPLPVVRAAPVVVAALPVVASAPAVAVAQTYETAATSGPSAGQIGCYSSAPVAEVVRLRNGGTSVVCTRGDGTLTGWRPPIYPAGSRVGAALSDPIQVVNGKSRTRHAAADTVYAAAEVGVNHAAADVSQVVPAGYKPAWKDGRLNSQRGIGTAQGNADQNAIWSQKVPAQLVADVAKKKAQRKASRVTVSTMNEAVAPAAPRAAKAGVSYVQVGTFGVASNAAGAAQRLQALGLPVAKSVLHKGGKDLQIVMAGPFGSAAEAQAALGMARQAGFGDAILR